MRIKNENLFIGIGAVGLIGLSFLHLSKTQSKEGSYYKKPKVVLYHLEYCPFCEKVRDKLEELDIEWTSKDVSEAKYKKQLSKKRDGVTTVPYIEVDGVGMGESADIVQMLEQNFGD
jgi:glutaredoxin 3